MTPRSLFRAAAFAEAVTWGLLLAGMAQKYLLDAGDWGVSIGGALHGLVFLAFCVVTVLVAVNQRWSLGVTVAALAAAVPPFATVPAEVVLNRSGRLDGPWLTAPRDEPATPVRARLERALLVALRSPALAAGLGAGLVLAVFAGLVVVGPPGS